MEKLIIIDGEKGIKEIFCIMKIKIFFLLICLILFPVVSGINITPSYQISPESFNIVINENEYITKNISIISNVNHSCNITLESDLSVLFSDDSFMMMNETVNVSVHFFGEETGTGFIRIKEDGVVIQSIPVIISLSEEDIVEDDEGSVDLDLDLFPQIPVSGNYFAISFNESVNCSGFLWIKEQMFPVSFDDGFTILTVEKNIFGEARLWLQGYGFVHSFNIESGLEGSPSLIIPKSASINDVVDVRFVIGGEPISNKEIIVTSPFDTVETYITDVDGMIYPVFDEVGEWIVESSFQGKNVVQQVNVPYLKMDVSISKKVFNIGEKVGIVTDVNNAVITIRKDNSVKLQVSVDDGYLEYTPDESGSYSVTAISNDESKKGSNSFNVNIKAFIEIFDKNNMQTSVLKEGNEYLIKVVDDSGDVISEYSEVSIDSYVIHLNNGIGLWNPSFSGDLTLRLQDKNQYIGGDMSITVMESDEVIQESDNTFLYVLFGMIFIIVGGFVLYYLYDKGIIYLPDSVKNLLKHDGNIPDDLF